MTHAPDPSQPDPSPNAGAASVSAPIQPAAVPPAALDAIARPEQPPMDDAVEGTEEEKTEEAAAKLGDFA